MEHLSLQHCKTVLAQIGDHTILKVIFAYCSCTYAYIFGDGQILIPVFLLVILDGITGVMVAIKTKEVSSKGFRRGAIKFLVYLILIATAGILDREFPGQYATAVMKTFLMVTEAISIMENIGKLGWPVPLKLIAFLKVHRDVEKSDKK